MLHLAATVRLINRNLLWPFHHRVELTDVLLWLVLLAVIAGEWHFVVERIDGEFSDLEVE